MLSISRRLMHKTSLIQIIIWARRLHQVRGPGSAEPTYSTLYSACLCLFVHSLLVMLTANVASQWFGKLTLKTAVILSVAPLHHFWPSSWTLTITAMASSPPKNCWSLSCLKDTCLHLQLLSLQRGSFLVLAKSTIQRGTVLLPRELRCYYSSKTTWNLP